MPVMNGVEGTEKESDFHYEAGGIMVCQQNCRNSVGLQPKTFCQKAEKPP